MKKLLFIFCLSFVAVMQVMAIRPDTLRVYSIDGHFIRNFSGKELIGKTVKSYQILYAKSQKASKVIETHIIKTTASTSNKAEPHYLLDGTMKELNKEEMNKISPDKIVSIQCLKAGSKAAKEFSSQNDDRDIIIIKVKNAESQ